MGIARVQSFRKTTLCSTFCFHKVIVFFLEVSRFRAFFCEETGFKPFEVLHAEARFFWLLVAAFAAAFRWTEWMQSQWQKNLNLKIQVVLRENKVYLSEVQNNPPAIFRKGVAPDRPTCLATLETFADWSPENYIQLKDPDYQSILKKLGDAATPQDQKKFCTEGVRYIMDRHLLIPLGPIHFSVLAKKTFSGWKLNSMNQLDLAGLTAPTSQTETK